MSRSSSAFEIIVNSAALKIWILRLSHARVRPLTYAFEVHPARVTKMAAPLAGDRLAELDAIADRLGLADSSFAKRFLRSPRGSGRTSCPSASEPISGYFTGTGIIRCS
jgi:hypothetical protein